MDSIKGSHRGVENCIKCYLWEKWKERSHDTKCCYLDSLKHSTINQQLKQIIDAAMLVYTTQSGSDKRINLMWEQVRVPKQPGNTECGYYVCKFMKEIIDSGLDVLVNANIGDGKQIYKDVDLDEIREDWAHYVSNFVLA